MKTINLTQGQVALVDDWRHEELNQWKWYAHWSKATRSFYAVRKEGKGRFRKMVALHRIVANTPKDMTCDHLHHNTLDDQEHNLRNVTYSQNAMNRRVGYGKPLKEKNIFTDHHGFRVQVKKDGDRVFDKRFKTIDEAIAARDEAVKKYHGEFAYQPTSED